MGPVASQQRLVPVYFLQAMALAMVKVAVLAWGDVAVAAAVEAAMQTVENGSAVDCERLHGHTVRYLAAISASDRVFEGPH